MTRRRNYWFLDLLLDLFLDVLPDMFLDVLPVVFLDVLPDVFLDVLLANEWHEFDFLDAHDAVLSSRNGSE